MNQAIAIRSSVVKPYMGVAWLNGYSHRHCHPKRAAATYFGFNAASGGGRGLIAGVQKRAHDHALKLAPVLVWFHRKPLDLVRLHEELVERIVVDQRQSGDGGRTRHFRSDVVCRNRLGI